MAIKTKLPKIPNFDVKLKENQNRQFFGNFVLIAMGELNMNTAKNAPTLPAEL